MLPLPLNFLVLNCLRQRVLGFLMILPCILIQIGIIWSVGPYLQLSLILGIERVDGSIINHPNYMILFSLTLTISLILFFLSLVIGFVCNALLSWLIFRWPLAKVITVYLKSDVPVAWLAPPKSDMATDRIIESLLDWEKEQQKGVFDYVFSVRFLLKNIFFFSCFYLYGQLPIAIFIWIGKVSSAEAFFEGNAFMSGFGRFLSFPRILLLHIAFYFLFRAAFWKIFNWNYHKMRSLYNI